jgi:hypothetical protein
LFSAHPADDEPGTPDPRDPAPSQTAELELVPCRAWRFAAQKTTRAWNEWLAADSRERPELYHCYVCALAQEEQAAVAIERAVNLEGNSKERSVSSALTAHSDDSRPSYRRPRTAVPQPFDHGWLTLRDASHKEGDCAPCRETDRSRS